MNITKYCTFNEIELFESKIAIIFFYEILNGLNFKIKQRHLTKRKLEIKSPDTHFLFLNLYGFWCNWGLMRKVLSDLNVTLCVSPEACKKIIHLGQPGSEI